MDITKSTCLILVCDKRIKKSHFSDLKSEDILDSGTGFFINSEGLIATAGHVVKEVENEVFFIVKDDKLLPLVVIKRFDLLGNGEYNDYAICQVELKSEDYFDTTEFVEPNEGDKLILNGFTKHEKAKFSQEYSFSNGVMYFNEIRAIYSWKGIKPFGNKGVFENGFVMHYEETFHNSLHGMSGGPILNLKKEVIGLLCRGYNLNGGQGLFTSSLLP